MGKLSIRLTLLLFSVFVFSQNSKSEFVSNNKAFESVTEYNPSFEIEFIDKRKYVQNKIPFESIDNYVNGFLESYQDIHLSDKSTQLKKKKISVFVDFFNFVESSSQKLTLKGIVKVKLNGADYSDLNGEFVVNDELFTKLKFKSLKNQKNSIVIKSLVEEFSKRLSNKISRNINEALKNENHFVFRVISIGTSEQMDDEELTIKEATLDALKNGSTLAFGTNVFNQSEIVDYGDVTDIVRAESGGNVLYYEVDEDSILFTDDGYCCLVVKSLIRKMK